MFFGRSNFFKQKACHQTEKKNNTQYREDKKTCMLLKSFVALALIPELDFEIGMTALRSEISDHNKSSSLITSVILIQFGLK